MSDEFFWVISSRQKQYKGGGGDRPDAETHIQTNNKHTTHTQTYAQAGCVYRCCQMFSEAVPVHTCSTLQLPTLNGFTVKKKRKRKGKSKKKSYLKKICIHLYMNYTHVMSGMKRIIPFCYFWRLSYIPIKIHLLKLIRILKYCYSWLVFCKWFAINKLYFNIHLQIHTIILLPLWYLL